ncbi:hypothetical protein GQ54DRAFT_25926 [Martensiomyces pterosporus]|nr:hypothetical protein GQ54DRAFT_25926 [Martensiomyces pterosporus]
MKRRKIRSNEDGRPAADFIRVRGGRAGAWASECACCLRAQPRASALMVRGDGGDELHQAAGSQHYWSERWAQKCGCIQGPSSHSPCRLPVIGCCPSPAFHFPMLCCFEKVPERNQRALPYFFFVGKGLASTLPGHKRTHASRSAPLQVIFRWAVFLCRSRSIAQLTAYRLPLRGLGHGTYY